MLSRLFVAVACAGVLVAQSTPFPAPPEVLAGFSLRTGTVQELALPAAPAPAFQTRVAFAGINHTLDLAAHDVRSPNFKLLVEDATGVREVPAPPSVTYRGVVANQPGSAVAASLIDGQLWATIHLEDGALWAVQPLSEWNPAMPRDNHVVYSSSAVHHDGIRCGTSHAAADREPPTANAGPAALKICEIAIDADLAYYNRYGANTTNVQNRVTTIMNSVATIYVRDTEIDYTITTLLIRTVQVYAWSGDTCNLLSQFRSYWNSNHGGIRRDVAHLFTGEGSFSGVIGCAYGGTVCTTSGYGVSKAYSGSMTTNVGLIAHEIGHNWNAPHCNSSTPCNIMCSGLGGCSGNLSAFAPTSISRIVSFKNSRTCLGDPLPPIVSSLAPTTTTSYQPVEITATGQRLDSVTSLTVDGRQANFTLINATTLRFTPPTPLTIGPNAVIASNSAGASNPQNLTISGNHPGVLVAANLLARNFPNRIDIYSDANWTGVLLVSTSNAASSLPGLVDLGIGAAFTELWELAVLPCGGNGNGFLLLPLPVTAPIGLNLWLQAITLDPTNVTTPFEVTNVRQTTII